MTDYEGFVEGRAQLAAVIENILKKEHTRFEAWKQRPVSSSSTVVEGETRPWDAVVFDLDDTLAPSKGPLKDAYRYMEGFMLQHMPNTQKEVQGRIAELMRRYVCGYDLL